MKIYAFSGLGADKRVFSTLNLKYELIPIHWQPINPEESLKEYALRCIAPYSPSAPFAILGVSFGGILANEIHHSINPNCTFLVSSVFKRSDLPLLYRLLLRSSVIKNIPAWLFRPPTWIAQTLFRTKNPLLKSIIKDTDPKFVKWAIYALSKWKEQPVITNNKFLISGSKDIVLPSLKTTNTIVEGGGHFMIVDQASQIESFLHQNLEKYI